MDIIQIAAYTYLFIKLIDFVKWIKSNRPSIRISRFVDRVTGYPGSQSFYRMHSGTELNYSFGPWPAKIRGTVILFKKGVGPILEWDCLTEKMKPTKVVFTKKPKFK